MTRRRSTREAGRKPRRPMSRIRPPLTTSMTSPSTFSPELNFSSMRFQARSYSARFLDRTRRPSLSSFWRTRASMAITECRRWCCRVSVLADGQLAHGNDAFGLVADVQKNLVLADLDDRAVNDVALVEVDNGVVDEAVHLGVVDSIKREDRRVLKFTQGWTPFEPGPRSSWSSRPGVPFASQTSTGYEEIHVSRPICQGMRPMRMQVGTIRHFSANRHRRRRTDQVKHRIAKKASPYLRNPFGTSADDG